MIRTTLTGFRTYAVLCAGVALLLGLNAASHGADKQPRDRDAAYVLSITGSDATVSYSGDCWLRLDEDSERRITLGATLPVTRELRGRGIRCDIVQDGASGSLTVEIVRKNRSSRSRSRTQGAGSRIVIQVR